MEYLYLRNNISRHGGSLMYLEVEVVGESEKAIKFNTHGVIFWLPKAVAKRPKTGVFKGDLCCAHWWTGFDDHVYKKVKDFICFASAK